MFTKRFVLVASPCFGDDDPAAKPPVDDAAGGEVKFTPEQQAKLNGILAAEKKKIVAELENLKKIAGTSAKQKEDLEKQINDLKSTYLTKQEQEQEKFERSLNEYKTNYETTKAEAERWKNDFTNTIIDRDILAAASGDAFNAELVVSILKPNTRLVEVLNDDGKPTGKFEPRVKMTKLNKENKPVDLDLKPDEAVKLMKEMPEKYGSLFKSTQKSGTGGTHTPGKETDLADLARTNPEEYRRRYREENFQKRGK